MKSVTHSTISLPLVRRLSKAGFKASPTSIFNKSKLLERSSVFVFVVFKNLPTSVSYAVVEPKASFAIST